MPNSVPQRIGPFTRGIIYPETTRGSDAGITVGYVIPYRDVSGFVIARPEIEAPYYNGSIQGFSTAPGGLDAQGPMPLGLEFQTSGVFLKLPFGANGYSRVALVTGSIHNFFPPAAPTITNPGSAQIQHEYLDGAAAKYERARYVLMRSLGLSYAAAGAAPFDVDMVGSGDNVVDVDLAQTKTEYGYQGVSVFNGMARMAISALNPTWFTLAGIKAFRAGLDLGTVAEDVAFNDGVAGSVNMGMPSLKGNLELMMAGSGSGPEFDFTFYNYAVNRNLMSYDCVWTDATFAAAPFPTAMLRLQIASAQFSRRSTTPAGRLGRTIQQDWQHVLHPTLSKIPADSFGTVLGPYNISGTNNIVSHNIDGLGASSVTLATNAATTAASVASQLNADGTFTARAFADVFMGRVRITSKQTGGSGASSSVALTAPANNANATLGFNVTVMTGFNTPYRFSLWNLVNTNY